MNKTIPNDLVELVPDDYRSYFIEIKMRLTLLAQRASKAGGEKDEKVKEYFKELLADLLKQE